jgi:hypothetical protein
MAGPIDYLPGSQNEAAQILGQVLDLPFDTQVANARVTVGAASTQLLATGTGVGRVVKVKPVSTGATGAHVAYGEAATTSHHLVEPGEAEVASWEGSAVNAIRAGGSDITVEVLCLRRA